MNKKEIISKWRNSLITDFETEKNLNNETLEDIANKIADKTFTYINENCNKRKIKNVEIRILTDEAIIGLKDDVKFDCRRTLNETKIIAELLIIDFNSTNGIKATQLNNAFVGVNLELKN